MKKGRISFKKLFIFFSIIFLFILICIYSYRFIYFYSLENKETEEGKTNNYFSTQLEKTINVSDATGGLYIYEDQYIYKFNSLENYIWYSGQLWRILRINEDKTMDIIMDESLTILNINYEETNYIKTYLNKFYDKLDKELLVELNYCSDNYDNLDNLNCDNKKSSYITLLDIYTYNKSGGNTSFLNNNTNFWLINQNSNKDNWYVNKEGLLSVGEDTNSFTVRPVVRIKNEITLVDGKGTKENPYIIKQKDSNTILVGEYVNFNNNLWRITNVDDSRITISSIDCLSLDGECILQKFGVNNKYLNSNIYKYLNNTYYKSIENKEYIVKSKFQIGDYINYNIDNLSLKEMEAMIGISKVSDYYIANKINSYLLTTNDLQAIYSINENSNYYITLPNEIKAIYPVLNLDRTLNIISGDGTINNPYVFGR